MAIDPTHMLNVVQAQAPERPQAKGEADRELDRVFAQMLLKEVSKTMADGPLMGGPMGQAFDGLWVETMADALIESGFSLGQRVEGHGSGEAWEEAPHVHAPATVTSHFGIRHDPFTGQARHHDGIDIAAPRGTPIPSARAGTVLFAGDRGGYGNVVIVDHGEGLQTRYAHCDRLDVSTGDRIEAGEIIGTVGSTGRSTGPHLHLEARIDGRPVDPMQALGELPLKLDIP